MASISTASRSRRGVRGLKYRCGGIGEYCPKASWNSPDTLQAACHVLAWGLRNNGRQKIAKLESERSAFAGNHRKASAEQGGDELARLK